jgi:hypothetical protein
MLHKFSSKGKLYQANPEAWYLLVNQTMPLSSTNKNFTLLTVKEINWKKNILQYSR